MKIVGIILGALLVISGVYCIMSPVVTFATLGWVVGLSMVFEGFWSMLTWSNRKRLGFADGWTLCGAIISVIFGAMVLASGYLRFAVDSVLAYMVAFWLIAAGVTRIAASVGLHAAHRENEEIGSSWFLVLLAGILVLIFGVICLIHPLIAVVSAGTFMGLGIISAGCALIVAGIMM